MSNYHRRYASGGTFFFTVNLQDRSSRLLTDHIGVLRTGWRKAETTWPFETIAVCILPDHFHCLWKLPEGDHDFSVRMRLIKTFFTKALPPSARLQAGRRPGERGIWQRRFWEHLVRDATELEDYINYIHHNPVKHGHVSEMDDWPYSSWHRYKLNMGTDEIPALGKLQTGEA